MINKAETIATWEVIWTRRFWLKNMFLARKDLLFCVSDGFRFATHFLLLDLFFHFP